MLWDQVPLAWGTSVGGPQQAEGLLLPGWCVEVRNLLSVLRLLLID